MPRTRSLAWSQLKVGLLTLVAVVLSLLFVFFVGGQGAFAWQQYHLKTRFTDVQGLKTGAVVRVAGVEVGTVRDMQFVGSEVEVVLRVSRKMQDRIRTGSRASVGSLSLLGAPVVDITPSLEGAAVPDWGYVPSARPMGQLSAVAEGATRSLEEATRVLADLRRGRGTVGKLFTDDALYRDIRGFVDAAETVVTQLSAGEGTIAKLMRDDALYASLKQSVDDLSAVTARLRAGQGSLGRLLSDAAFAESLTATTGHLEEVTGRIRRGEGTVGRLVNDDTLYKRLDETIERLDRVLAGLNKGDGTAGRLLHDAELYENMNKAVAELRALVGEIRQDPKKYLNVKVSLF
jgi:phospholipid/cholesterol/gamma-HCH transport system substrate-binding protein